MSKRTIALIESTATNWKIRIQYDSEWREYVCTPVTGGKAHSSASYHTDDREDAMSTARTMARDFLPPVENAPSLGDLLKGSKA